MTYPDVSNSQGHSIAVNLLVTAATVHSLYSLSARELPLSKHLWSVSKDTVVTQIVKNSGNLRVHLIALRNKQSVKKFIVY